MLQLNVKSLYCIFVLYYLSIKSLKQGDILSYGPRDQSNENNGMHFKIILGLWWLLFCR